MRASNKPRRVRRTTALPLLRSKPPARRGRPREVSDAELFDANSPSRGSLVRRSRASPSNSHGSLGREVRDSELFSTSRDGRGRGGGSGGRSGSIGHEVRDSELFSASRRTTSVGREVRDSELFNTSAAVTNRARSVSSSRAGAASRVGREVCDSELFQQSSRGGSSSRTRQRETASVSRPDSREGTESAQSTPSAPKRARRIAPWEASRAALVQAGITVTYPTATESSVPYAPLPWRAGRDTAEASRLGGTKRLSELALELLRLRVRHKQIHDLSELPEDFVYALLASDGIDAATLLRVEQNNPQLAPVVEAAWARLCQVETLPTHFKSWRHMYEHGLSQERQALEDARLRVRASYERARTGPRQHREVFISDSARPPSRRRRETSEPQSTLARLRDQHRRARRR